LGAELQVSRQAISKWESDATLPEVDKLIALSKRFGVTVGWLLGTEEEPQQSSPGELTEEQLRMVEEIVRRYASQQAPSQAQETQQRQAIEAAVAQRTQQMEQAQAAQTQKRKKIARWGVLALSVVVIALLIWNFQLSGTVNDLTLQLYSVYSSLSRLSDSIDSQQAAIDNVVDRLEDTIAEQSSLLSSKQLTLVKLDGAGVTIQLSAVPKYPAEGTEDFTFYAVLDGERYYGDSATWDGSVYTAQVTLPAQNGASYYLTLPTAIGTMTTCLADAAKSTEDACNLGWSTQLSLNVNGILTHQDGWTYRLGDLYFEDAWDGKQIDLYDSGDGFDYGDGGDDLPTQSYTVTEELLLGDQVINSTTVTDAKELFGSQTLAEDLLSQANANDLLVWRYTITLQDGRSVTCYDGNALQAVQQDTLLDWALVSVDNDTGILLGA
jgi:transcriptional regulator with XRE-family HTH domain